MKAGKVFQRLVTLALVLVALPGAAVSVPAGAGDPAESGRVESIHGSYVYFDRLAGGNECPIRNAAQIFCFTAVSFTDDWDYVYYLWMRFPADWTVNNVYVQGTPTCANGGTFGAFDWWGLADNEVRIEHIRYHADPSDSCQASYCFQVTSGSSTPGLNFALVSWYWVSSGYGSLPFCPCSSDGYTPIGQATCDEAAWPPAAIPPCPRVYLPLFLRGY
jgi:hypothetical protein